MFCFVFISIFVIVVVAIVVIVVVEKKAPDCVLVVLSTPSEMSMADVTCSHYENLPMQERDIF